MLAVSSSRQADTFLQNLMTRAIVGDEQQRERNLVALAGGTFLNSGATPESPS
jgi:hypothetical protein